jgi:hypothetical protein
MKIDDSGTIPPEYCLAFDFEEQKYTVIIAGLKKKDLRALKKILEEA